MLAPVILFVYNRPQHTFKTLQALSQNSLAAQSVLYIYADAPKANATPNEINNVTLVRNIIKQQQWCGQVHIIERDTNWGLADNIVNGVTEVVNKYGKIVVLEDDILTSTGFLQYMNEALDIYANDEQVMHISGYMFPIKGKLPETFFYNTASCWGWGTWERAWKHFNTDANILLQKVTAGNVSKFNIGNSYNFVNQLQQNANGAIKTWAVKWYAVIFLHNGFSLHPFPSLVNNIGHDGLGENSDNSTLFNWPTIAQSVTVNKIPIVESPEAIEKMIAFNHSITAYYSSRPKINLKEKVKKYIPATIKHSLKTWYKRFLINKLSKLPRFTPFTTNLVYGKPLKGIDASSFLFMYDEIFNKNIYHFKAVTTKPYIIDCGANIGLSVIYFKNLYPNAEIVAFEPDPKIFKILQQNIASAGLKNVTTVNAALWDKEGELHFNQEGADGGSITNKESGTITVKTVPLSQYMHKPISFLKIDIEGAENVVLDEIKSKLHLVDNIFIEYHSYPDKPQQLDSILHLLKQENFRSYLYNISNLTANPFIQIQQSANMDMQLNICAVRNPVNH